MNIKHSPILIPQVLNKNHQARREGMLPTGTQSILINECFTRTNIGEGLRK